MGASRRSARENLEFLHNDVEKYDVFLSYNRADQEAVKAIAVKLRDLGLRPWFDIWEVPPFARWQDELQKVISKVKAAAVFYGRSGLGPWEDLEVQALLREFARRRIRMGIVILPGCPRRRPLNAPPFLELFNRVDFRISDPDPMKQLMWGITNTRPQHAHQ
jgi:hypothetical protein